MNEVGSALKRIVDALPQQSDLQDDIRLVIATLRETAMKNESAQEWIEKACNQLKNFRGYYVQVAITHGLTADMNMLSALDGFIQRAPVLDGAELVRQIDECEEQIANDKEINDDAVSDRFAH